MKTLNKYSKTIHKMKRNLQLKPCFWRSDYAIRKLDMQKAQSRVVALGYEGNTRNMHLNDLAKELKSWWFKMRKKFRSV